MIDLNKDLQTRDGRKLARILTTSGRGDFKIVGYLQDDDVVKAWKADGSFTSKPFSCAMDLINVPPVKYIRYLTWYGDRVGCDYTSALAARTNASKGLTSIIRVEIEDDRFDD